MIETVSNFYKLLSTLPYVDPKHILSAPTGGWPNISHDVVVGVFHKTEAVLELLRHLPYLDQDRGHSNKYVIGPDVEPCDYRQVLIADGTSETTKAMLAPSSVVDFPAWCVPLATAKSRSGRHVILDTSDGTITEYDPEGAADDHDYADDDPRAWRNVCRWAEDPTDRTVTVTAYFERLEKRFRDLEWIGFWRMNEMPNLWMGYDFTWPNEEKETKVCYVAPRIAVQRC